MDRVANRFDSFRRHHPEAVTMAEVFLVLSAITAFTAISVRLHRYLPLGGSPLLPSSRYAPFLLGPFTAYIVGFSGGAILYAAVRGVRIPTAVPRNVRLPAIVSAIVVPSIFVLVSTVLTDVVFDSTLSEAANVAYSPNVSIEFVVMTRIIPGVFSAVGVSFLLGIVTLEPIRNRVSAHRYHLVALATVVMVFYRELQWKAATSGFVAVRDGAAALFLLGVVATVATGVSIGLTYRAATTDSFDRLVRLAYVPVFALALLATVGVVQELLEYPGVIQHLLWAVAFVAAGYGYDRTRSIWVPIATFVLFECSIAVVLFLEATRGLALAPA